MFSQQVIRFLLLFFTLSSAILSEAQSDTIVRVESPYKNEYNPWFKLTTFQRGFDSDSLIMLLDELEKKPRVEWSRLDSLNFSRTSLQTGNTELSSYYFGHLNVDYDLENAYWWDQIMMLILNKDYEGGIEAIHRDNPGIFEGSKIYFLDRLLLAYIAESKVEKWYKDNSILKWEIDTSLANVDKSDERFTRDIITPLKNLNFVLRNMIHFIHESDPIIARACYEMGLILEKYVSDTQAYIAYSLGRNFNKWDKEVLAAIKQVKGKLSQRKLKIPVFRNYLPRINQWRFEYEVLKEKIILQKNDTIQKITPTLIVKKEKMDFPFSPELFIISGILILFLLVLIFLKAKKN